MQRRGQRVLVMGLGVHGGGLGVARWLLQQGAQVTITDLASADKLAAPLAALAQAEQDSGSHIRYVLGEHHPEDFTSHDMLVVNPAVRPDSPWLALAREAGVPIETEMTLFFRQCPGPIIGITGTKGKTTTTMLTGALLRQHYADTVVAGNLRVSALEALDRITPATPVVLELSSFQLVGLGEVGLSPAYACVTNLSPDHLNYHGSLAEYARAKQQILLHQPSDGVVVLNQELLDAPPEESGADWAQAAKTAAGTLITFSTQPDNSRADCFMTEQGQVMIAGEYMLDTADIRLPGRHNRGNVLAALALARCFDIDAALLRGAVRDFQGVEHRLETVHILDGVRYVNDTTATNPAAAVAALESFDSPLVLLAGGADKHLALEAFAERIAQRASVLILLAGSATERLQQAVLAQGRADLHVLGPYDDFAAALRAAQQAATAGDTVLLSPGCASFGMFRNEFHRGDEFRRIVRDELA
jgi:UDP-N-acetylmuramoylalanine--D-glutamate ligase